MANYIVNGNDLTLVADSIRSKGNTSGELVWPTGFKNAIDNINVKDMCIKTTEFNDVVKVDDAAALDARDVVAKIEPVQDLHGYDHPWPAGGGKSLIDSSLYKTTAITDSGVTATPTGDGRFTLSGTPTSQTVNIWMLGAYGPTQQTKFTLPAGTYTMKDCALFKGTSNPIVAVGGTGANSTVIGGIAKFTIPNEMEVSAVRAPTMTVGQNYNGYVLAPMIVRGEYTAETFPAWEPYSNICPITGWTGAEATRTGKNLWNPDNVISGAALSPTSNTIFESANSTSVYIACKPNTTYTISKKVGQRFRVATTKVFPAVGVERYNFARNDTGTSLTITTGADDAYIVAFVHNVSNDGDNLSEILESIQIEIGSTATAYEPYQGDVLDITFPSEAGTVYGGTVDLTKGKLVVDRAMVDLGTMVWTRNTTSGYPFYQTGSIGSMIAHPTSTTDIIPVICDMLPSTSSASIYNHTAQGIGVHTNGTIRLYYITQPDTETELVNALSGHSIVYPLANPITYDLTPREIEMFKGTNVLSSTTGKTQLKYFTEAFEPLAEEIGFVNGGDY